MPHQADARRLGLKRGMNDMIWSAIWLTARLATVTTVVLLIVGLPLAWVLSRSRGPWAEAVGALVAMPLVLPPSVLGFYLLLLLGRSGPVGRIAEAMGLSAPAFSFEGLVIGSVIYSLPFMVQPVRNAIDMIGNGPLEAAATLRASPVSVFFDVVLPLARPGIVTGAVMSFAHTVGEFGVILMIGGNIPGETRVISTLIYDMVERQDYAAAHGLAGGMIIFAFVVVLATAFIEQRARRRRS